jgi:hypothetical protein
MAAKNNSFFWLANVKKIFSSETAWPNLAKLFQRRRLKYEKLTDERQTPSDDNTSHGPLGQVS